MKSSTIQIPQKWLTLFQKHKYWVLIVGVGALLIVWPKGNAVTSSGDSQTLTGYTAFAVDEMEQRLCQTLSQVEGAGKVEVMLTLKADMEVLYLEDVDEKSYTQWENGQAVAQDRESKSKTVLPGQSGGGPVITQRIYPEYQGALIVCEGAGNALVQLQIKEAVSALTGLSGPAITVTKMMGGE